MRRIVKIQWLDTSDSLVGEFLTEYDAAGSITQIDDHQTVDTFTYNDAGWLTLHTRAGSALPTLPSTSSLTTPASSFNYDYLVDGSVDTITQVAGGDTVITDFDHEGADPLDLILGRHAPFAQSPGAFATLRFASTFTGFLPFLFGVLRIGLIESLCRILLF